MKKLLIVFALMLAATTTHGDGSILRAELIRTIYISQPGGIKRANEIRFREFTQLRSTKLFGHWVRMHKATHEPLRCAEKMIRLVCMDDYKPKFVSGHRVNSKFAGNEISNHFFGTAFDLDPNENSCCGCRKYKDGSGFSQRPICDGWKPEDGPGPHAVPMCWIRVLEANGFYWLGYDEKLYDTMHFSYLAKIGAVSCGKP